MKKKTIHQRIGIRISPILAEIEDALWEDDFEENGPQRFTVAGTRAAVKIFSTVVMDKIWEKAEREGLSLEEKSALAHQAGTEIRELFKRFTGVDSHDLYKL